VRRFAEAVVAGAAIALAVAGAAAPGGTQVAPPTPAEQAGLAKRPTYTAFVSQRIYFVMPDRYANG
jgi:hypothetical protein